MHISFVVRMFCMFRSLQFLKDVTWEDVFSAWKSAEGQDPIWQRFAVEEKGWDSWENWRRYQSSFIEADKRLWKIYEITDPNKVIPAFRIGPFQGWQQHFMEKNRHTFADLVRDKTDWVSQNIGVRVRLEHFPDSTQFIGLYVEDEDAIVLYEGHHRAAAIALAIHRGTPITFQTNPTIALTSVAGDVLPLLNRLLEQGSENSQRALKEV